ncbi:phytoene desaturase family protein [Blastococcus sp. SYSU DS0533]
MAAHDVVIIGSGINSLVAGATLARAGRDVGIYERAPRLGGAIRTETDTPAPGFTTDLLSCWHPLFVGGPAYPSLADDLAARGVVYRNTDLPAAAALRDGSTAVLSTDADVTAADFDRLSPGDGDAWRTFLEDFGSRAGIAFGALGTELLSLDGLKLAGQAVRQLGPRGLQQFGAEGLESARTWLSGTFDSPTVHGLLSPWVGHEGLGPDDAFSGFINKVIALALAQGGCPVPEGGGVRLVEALAGIVTDAGGTTRTGADVVAIQTAGGRATGVRLADGEVVTAREAVLASVTPQQLYLGLLDGVAAVPDRVREAARGPRAVRRPGRRRALPARDQPGLRTDRAPGALPRGPAVVEPQPGRRRPLRRRLHHRPVPAVAAHPADPRAPHRRRRAVAHRRLDPPRPGPGRGERAAGGAAGDPGGEARAARGRPPGAGRLIGGRTRGRRSGTVGRNP